MIRFARALPRLLLLLALGIIIVTMAGLAVAPQLANLTTATHGVASDVILDDLSVRSYVYASDGTLLTTLQEEENRAPISIDDVPDHVIDAVLAAEDSDFFEHKGVNVRATVRALLSNVESGQIEQGGSTITQQLVKQSLLDSTQDLDRKTREAFLAVRLEKQMSKRQILERYLNTIYLANHSYGIQSAAETYFGVDASELDLAQAALLAGMIRNPIEYDPLRYPDVARERRRIALRRMVEEGMITEDEAAFANEAPLPDVAIEYIPPPDDYFVEEVKQALLADERLGETRTERFDAVFRGGLQIHTTLDLGAQFLAEIARNDVLAPFSIEGQPALFVAGKNQAGEDAIGTVAMASVESSTGAVRSLVGGPGFGDDFKFNLATQGYRQPGSAFKTFVLLELLEQGYSPSDRISGSGPCRFRIPGVEEVYEVNNFGRSRGFSGSITSMTTNSSNCGYVRLGQIAGIDNVVDLAGDLGIRTRNASNEIVDLDPSIFSTPLGTQEVTPLAMSAAYAAIANDGYYNPPYFVERVLDRNGATVFEHVDEGYRAFSIETAQFAADILKDNVTGGTGGAARVSGHDVGGKTGTAQDFSNGWFAGFSQHLSTAVWMGAIEGNVPMRSVGGRSVTGGSYPARIFGAYMNAMHEGLEVLDFADPGRRPSTGSTLRLDRDVDLSSSSGVTSRPRTTAPPATAAPTTAAPTTTAADEPTPTTGAESTTPPTTVGEGTPIDGDFDD
ncbi:MAG: transglycosylase domain-containing protein [Acidimicrobiales bacterium]|nr:transglycosylase domain-containing protein [Acidimicrobiales bacterium]